MNIEEYGYLIKDNGDVISKKTGEPLKFSDNGKGYMISRISFKGKSFSITHHRVVAYKFLGECPKGYEVGHKDDVRHNNHPSNLEYVTKSENNKQSYDRGNRSAKGINNANAKVTEEQVKGFCEKLSKNPKINLSAESRESGISRATLSAIKNRKQWKEISINYHF